MMKISKASQKSKQESPLSFHQQETNIPKAEFKKLEWSHPYPGNQLNRHLSNAAQRDLLQTLGTKSMRKGLLLDYADVDLMIYLGFRHPLTGEALSYKTLQDAPLTNQQWETYRKRIQRILKPLENKGWLKRYITKYHKEGQVRTRRSIELIPLETWKNTFETSKYADGTNESHNTYTKQKSKISDPSIPQEKSVKKEFIETHGLLKKDPKELESPTNEIRQLQIQVLRSALKGCNQRVDYQLWVTLLLCMGFSRTGLKIFRKWVFEPVLKHKPDSFYRIIESLSNSLQNSSQSKNIIKHSGAWLMAEFLCCAGIRRSTTPKSKPIAQKSNKSDQSSQKKNIVPQLESEQERVSKKKKTPQWQQFRRRLQEELKLEQYEGWLDSIYLDGIGADIVVFAGIPHPLFRNDIANNHDSLFRKILEELFPDQVKIGQRKFTYC